MSIIKKIISYITSKAEISIKPVEKSEILSRFIFSKKQFNYSAFLPSRKNGETSVFRTSGISDKEIWAIGDREVAIVRNKPVLGRADILSRIIFSKNLKVLPSEPPVRHANIVGWPEEKHEQKLIAIEIAKSSTFLKLPQRT